MVGKVLNNCRICIGFPIPAWKAKANDWSIAKVTSWVKTAGGTVQQNFDEATATHLVVDEKQWKNKTRTVQAALDANASNENGRKIHIVSPEWLETCLEEQKKCREGTYLWEKLDQVASGSKQKKRGKSGGDDMDAGENAGETRKAPQALLGEVFQESTEPFVEERDLRAYEAEIAGEAKARKEREEAEARIKELEKLEAEKKRRERAEMMRKTVKRGRGDVFNGEYIFQPSACIW
jgi:type II restriction/modification system DNA methylase subunit YeeA